MLSTINILFCLTLPASVWSILYSLHVSIHVWTIISNKIHPVYFFFSSCFYILIFIEPDLRNTPSITVRILQKVNRYHFAHELQAGAGKFYRNDKIILLSTPFQSSQCWVKIAVVMLCSMLETSTRIRTLLTFIKWSNYSLVTQQIHWPYQPKQSPSCLHNWLVKNGIVW